ncbi:MAG: hypothetical protein LBL52_01850 [Rickettsiales bacterium]|nr:hypothetical protein [Rickettsiales bacterium]
MPGACQVGATKDCTYDKTLSLEEAVRCIGTPAKSRWTLVKKEEGPRGPQKLGMLSPGIYRVDLWHTEASWTSRIVVLAQDTDYGTWSGKFVDSGAHVCIDNSSEDWTTVQRFNNCGGRYHTINANSSTQKPSTVSYVPGITVSDMIYTIDPTVAIYKLD